MSSADFVQRVVKVNLISRPGYSVSDIDLRQWKVYAGEYNINNKDPYEREYRVRSVIMHPAFNWTSIENDIALVIIDGSIQ